MLRDATSRPVFADTLRAENSFDLVRLVAASTVLISHSFPLSGTYDASYKYLGLPPATVGVLSLFGVSGFLCSASWNGDPRFRAYFAKRALRIFPGLVVSLVLTALVLGTLVTTLTATDYLTRWEPYGYVLRGSMLNTFNTNLPGVFESNPFQEVFNGSLWTIPVEWCLYCAIVGAAVLGILRRPQVLSTLLVAVFALVAAKAQVINPNIDPSQERSSAVLSLVPCGSFLVGVLLFQLRSRIHRHPASLAAVVATLALPIPHALHIALLMVSVPYGAVHLGLLPAGRERVITQAGDASYGIYVYSFPIQQAVVQWIPGIDWLALTAITLPLCWSLGYISWHTIELAAQRRFKARLAGAPRRAPQTGVLAPAAEG